jgi:isocitrate/isopropylmalate dehydrogenase
MAKSAAVSIRQKYNLYANVRDIYKVKKVYA